MSKLERPLVELDENFGFETEGLVCDWYFLMLKG